MPSLPRSSRSRSSSNHSRRARYRDAAQQTSGSRSSSQLASPNNGPRRTRTRPSATHTDRKRFGMNVYDNQTRIGEFDFEKIYPEDPIYEELGPNPRAWRVNLDECEVYDNDMVIEARDGLDLLLVFAGLFSAVLTTFVAQTSQALSDNFPAVSTSLLLEIVTLQRAFINGTPIDGISSSKMTSGPSRFDVWLNALWFTSLTLSLGTALMAVLVKQWLYQYMSIVSGTARDRSLIRFYRFDGLRKWHVLTIIGTLPIVLHVALGLFLAGLVVFLIPLNAPLAIIVGSITVVIYTMYTVSNILPIIYAQCPYRTPFSDILNVLMRPIFTLLSFISSSAPVRALHIFFASAVASAAHLYKPFSTTISNLFGASEKTSLYPSTSSKFPTLKEAERIAATSDDVAEGIACDALVWLHQMTSNPPTKSIILQSLGCLSDDVSCRLTVVNDDLVEALDEVIHTPSNCSICPGQESRAERLLRAQRHVETQWTQWYWEVDIEAFSPPFHILAAILTYAPSFSVNLRGGESRDWTAYHLFMQIMQEYSAGRPILLPYALWQRFMVVLRQQFRLKNTDNNLLLCRLILQSWDHVERTPPPFSGGVPITHATVPLNLKHVITEMLPQNDVPDSEPLRQLCILNDYIVSELSTNRQLVTDDTILTLHNIWRWIGKDASGTSGNCQVICRRAEKCILEVFVGDWSKELTDANILIWCYISVVFEYGRYCDHDSVPIELFTKLFSELCLSSVVADTSGFAISRILESAYSLDIEGAMAFYTFLCGSESPLFSPRTKLSYGTSTNICRVIAAFVSGLARGYHPQALTHQCMEFLCAEPNRLFTVCRILALDVVECASFEIREDNRRREKVTNNLSKLARLDPQRAAWQERRHYLIGVEPWDWPYFLIPESHRNMEAIQERMQFALKDLDDFFAYLENPPAFPPSELQTGSAIKLDSRPEPPMVVRRIRQMVSSVRTFRSNASSPVDIELANPPNYSNDRSSRASDPALAIEPAPPVLSNAARPSQPGDMV